MTGIIDVGGGLRGVYGSGVLDRCLDDNVTFDAVIGVSAGSANVATFAAGQRGRTKRFYCDYPFRREYMSFSNLCRGKRFLDLHYVYSGLSNEGMEDPFGFDGLERFPGRVVVVSTDAESGRTVYFEKSDFKRNDLYVLKASSALPIVCPEIKVGGRVCLDGGISAPVPVEKAFEIGCDKVVVILTMPRDARKTPGVDNLAAKLVGKKFPEAGRLIADRSRVYNEAVERLIELEKEGRVLIVSPDNTCGIKTLTRDRSGIEALYNKGYGDGGRIKEFIGSDKAVKE